MALGIKIQSKSCRRCMQKGNENICIILLPLIEVPHEYGTRSPRVVIEQPEGITQVSGCPLACKAIPSETSHLQLPRQPHRLHWLTESRSYRPPKPYYQYDNHRLHWLTESRSYRPPKTVLPVRQSGVCPCPLTQEPTSGQYPDV